jgi:hypothetical protein
MQQPFTETGGARIGWLNASWPFAQISADQGNLIISVLWRTYAFTLKQVLFIERYSGLTSEGIRIRHNVAEYPEKIIFWGNPDKLLNGIWSSGFAVDAR